MGDSRRAFEELGRFLVSRGFEMLEESSSPQPFGSHYVVYERDGSRVRIIWDGKEEWLWVQELLNERDDRGLEIREAVGRPLLLEEKWMRPLLELSVRSLPPAYAAVDAPTGTKVQIHVSGEEDHSWTMRRDEDGWAIYEGVGSAPETTVRLSSDTAWRLFYNARETEGMAGIHVEGNADLAQPLLQARSVMV